MMLKKLCQFLKLRQGKKAKRLEALKSQKLIITKTVVLTKESDFKTVVSYLNNLGIQTTNKSIPEIEREIDKKITESITIELAKHSDSTKVKHIGERYAAVTENRNLMMLKFHISALKSWTKDQSTEQPVVKF
ncbi:hypothetical protein [Winogradskyella rapida]|uniref:Uncharacterized protein n=1 Tax=Winogradskyella rapida TaxID=549701 RepID=A0ABW3KTM6_9FLAO